ncbi:Pyridoxal phosphate homeostasis protein [Vibrio stylophorae]|uniref:Pyridoxal phosphate homeostasis protein n=1 Tax=Vibrio stylophorae TaxID=659351 RepID=A0ABM8ZQL6_9VIBR|nr:YggS family pyridoxal phosphate-dependent enzyme [Vibrio stylophorae]CAH0532597.1 Pyridoxal phosphate homeostasis protein [Vibrio stylophorae]
MCSIKQNLTEVIHQIDQAAQKCGRRTDSVKLLAVSKTKPVEDIASAIDAGQRAFGENYVQEGVDKINYFADHPHANELQWHFIGPLQSNKSRLVAEHFDWMHSLDRAKIATRLSEQRPQNKAPLQVLIQVNISDEDSKSGVQLSEISALAEHIAQLPQLKLRGLMAIPEVSDDYDSQLATFSQLRDALVQLQATYSDVDTLSMGMSGDLDAAIAAGSTMVRIGTAIFGARNYAQNSDGDSQPSA